MSHGLRYEVNCSIMYTELPLLQRPAAARAAGFDGIELWWPFPDAVPSDTEVDHLVSAIQDADVQLVGLNFAAGDMPGGDRGLVSWPARSSEFRDNVDVVIGIGDRLGVTAFNALYGNRIDGVSAEEQDELATENLALAAAAAARIGATVLVEPVSGAPRYPLLTAADAVAAMDRAAAHGGVDSLRLLLDVYHLAVNGDDVAAVVSEHADRVGHVQVADSPGRGEPGTGDLDLDGPLAALWQSGYRGWVGLEYKPTAGTDAGLGWLPRERRGTPDRPAV